MLAWLWSSYGAGMLVVSLALAYIKQDPPAVRVRLIMTAMVVGAMASFVLASTTQTILAIGLAGIIAAAVATFTPVIWGLLQDMTPGGIAGPCVLRV